MIPCNDDTQLLNLSRAGDIKAFLVFANRYRDRIFEIFRFVLESHAAEELTLATFTVAYRKNHGNSEISAKIWIYQIAIDMLLFQKNVLKVSFEIKSQIRSNFDGSKICSFKSGALAQEISFQSFLMLLMKEVEKLDYDEIALIMRCDRNTVAAGMFEARQDIADYMSTSNRQIVFI